MQRKVSGCFLVVVTILYFVVSDSHCLEVISRREWRAAPPVRGPFLGYPPPYVVVHHSGTPTCTTTYKCKEFVRNLQSAHMNVNGWNDIGYNFLIGGNGKIYEGRGWYLQAAHSKGYNSKSIGICLIGNFDGSNDPPQIQLDALKDLISYGAKKGRIHADYDLIGHSQVSLTSCPGAQLFKEIKTWLHFQPNLY